MKVMQVKMLEIIDLTTLQIAATNQVRGKRPESMARLRMPVARFTTGLYKIGNPCCDTEC